MRESDAGMHQHGEEHLDEQAAEQDDPTRLHGTLVIICVGKPRYGVAGAAAPGYIIMCARTAREAT